MRWFHSDTTRQLHNAISNLNTLTHSRCRDHALSALRLLTDVNNNKNLTFVEVRSSGELKNGQTAVPRYTYILRHKGAEKTTDYALATIEEPQNVDSSIQKDMENRLTKPAPRFNHGEIKCNERLGSYKPGRMSAEEILETCGLDNQHERGTRCLSIIMELPHHKGLIREKVNELNRLTERANVCFVIKPHPEDPNVEVVLLTKDGKVVDSLRMYDTKIAFTCNEKYSEEYLYYQPGSGVLKRRLRESGQIKEYPEAIKYREIKDSKTGSGAVGGAVVGGLLLGPAGVLLGGAVGGAVGSEMKSSTVESYLVPAYQCVKTS